MPLPQNRGDRELEVIDAILTAIEIFLVEVRLALEEHAADPAGLRLPPLGATREREVIHLSDAGDAAPQPAD